MHKTYTFMTHNGTHSEIIDHLNMRSYRSNKAPEAASKFNSSSTKTGAEYELSRCSFRGYICTTGSECVFWCSSNDLLEKAMAPHSSTLAWKIPWMEEPGGLPTMESLRVRHNWATSLSVFTGSHWRRKWQPTSGFLPGESQGWGSLVGCRLWCCRVGHDWSDLAATAAMRFFYFNFVLFKFQASL